MGASKRLIEDPVAHVEVYLDDGYVSRGGYYYRHSRGQSGRRLSHEAFTLSALIVGGHVGRRARSFHESVASLDLGHVPGTPLADTTETEREALAAAIATVGQWDGFAASSASKLLHPARPRSIPVLDREAIGGAYARAHWTGGKASSRSILYAELPAVLNVFHGDLTSQGNEASWAVLERHTNRQFTRLQLLDMVWWVHYRRTSGNRERVGLERRHLTASSPAHAPPR